MCWAPRIILAALTSWLLEEKATMVDIRNDIFFRFCDVTKQNGRTTVGTLYREPLRDILVHYGNVYKIEKGQGEVYTVQLNPYKHNFAHI